MRLYRYDYDGGYGLGGSEYGPGTEYYVTNDEKEVMYWQHNLGSPWIRQVHNSFSHDLRIINDNPKDYYDDRFFGLIKQYRKCHYTYLRDIDESEIKKHNDFCALDIKQEDKDLSRPVITNAIHLLEV